MFPHPFPSRISMAWVHLRVSSTFLDIVEKTEDAEDCRGMISKCRADWEIVVNRGLQRLRKLEREQKVRKGN